MALFARPRRAPGCALLLILGLAFSARAQAPAAALAAAAPAVDVTADRLEYEGEGKYLIGIRNVHVHYLGQTLTADYVQVNTETQDSYAKGHVVLTRADGTVWKGDELVYNLKTGIGDFGKFSLQSDPFYVYGADSSMPEPNVIQLQKVMITPCEGDSPEVKVTARSARIVDQRYVYARHAVFYLGPVPFFYTPWYRKDLHGSGRWDFLPGYSSRLGVFLLTAYNYPLTDSRNVKGATLLNYYSERGWGVGQNLSWRNTNDAWRGFTRTFYIDDQKPFRDEVEQEERGTYLTDSQRYRLRLAHTQNFGSSDTLLADATYLSDPYVQRDFFREEYQESPEPENRLTLTRRGEYYTASLQLNKRLNDFYENVDRVPEARLDVPQVQIGDSPFYYESGNSAANLERVFPKESGRDDYSAVRLDSWHEISYPHRYLGFLSLTPRARYRGTYYSKTLEDPVTVTNFVTMVDTNTGLSTVTEEIDTTQAEGGAQFRSMAELGLSAFFKAFKVLDDGETQWGRGLRHVVEPHANYTYRPEPNLRPGNLYPFDDVDRLDRLHQVQFGLRNKLQSRHDESYVYDILDADVYTTYRIEKDPGEQDFGPLEAKVELRPAPWFYMDFDGAYDFEQSTLQTFNTQIAIVASDKSSLAVEYRYRDQQRSLLTSELTLFPGRKWSLGAYHRYEFETSQLEEQTYYLEHRMDCIGWAIGVRHEPSYDPNTDDSYAVWLQLWILALPGSSVQLGG